MVESVDIITLAANLGVPTFILYFILKEHSRKLDALNEGVSKNRVILLLIASSLGIGQGLSLITGDG